MIMGVGDFEVEGVIAVWIEQETAGEERLDRLLLADSIALLPTSPAAPVGRFLDKLSYCCQGT